MNFSVNKWCVLAVLTGLLFMGVHGRATPALPPSNNKVIIYPAATDTISGVYQAGLDNLKKTFAAK